MARRLRVGDREDRDEVRDRALADEPLRARDDVVVAVADGRVRIAAASEPASASVRANAMSRSPDASRGNQRACCSGVPARSSGSEPSSWTARISPVVAQARLSCSTARQTSGARRRARRARPGTAGPGCPGRRGAPRGPAGSRGPVDLGGPRGDPLVGQDPHGVAEVALLLGEAVGRRTARLGGRGHGTHRSRAWRSVRGRTSMRRRQLAGLARGSTLADGRTRNGEPAQARRKGHRRGRLHRAVVHHRRGERSGSWERSGSCSSSARRCRPPATRTRSRSPPRA